LTCAAGNKEISSLPLVQDKIKLQIFCKCILLSQQKCALNLNPILDIEYGAFLCSGADVAH
jgi:hypothetical protein